MLLKQVHIARILLAVLLFSQTGLAVNVMYCGESVDKITLNNIWKNAEESDNCSHFDQEVEQKACCADAGENEKCCFVEVISQSSADYLNVLGLNFDVFISSEPYFYQNNFNVVHTETQEISTKIGFSPNAPPLYKLYNQFIFYA